jgi:hypothetical protein
MSLKIPRPADPSLHPLVTGNYRLATPAIEAFYELVTRCLRYRIMGALIYGPSRVGKAEPSSTFGSCSRVSTRR